MEQVDIQIEPNLWIDHLAECLKNVCLKVVLIIVYIIFSFALRLFSIIFLQMYTFILIIQLFFIHLYINFHIMNWVSVLDAHFIEIKRFDTGVFLYCENENSPESLFMVASISICGNMSYRDFDCVYLCDSGLISSNGNPSHIDIMDVTHWCKVTDPI